MSEKIAKDDLVVFNSLTGNIIISTMKDNHRFSRTYSGYSQEEAIQIFLEEVNSNGVAQ